MYQIGRNLVDSDDYRHSVEFQSVDEWFGFASPPRAAGMDDL